MALRTVPIRRSGNRYSQFLGADRELAMFALLLCAALAVPAMDWRAFLAGGALWLVTIYLLRLAAKADPRLRDVYLRSLRYHPYYPARSGPFRVNTREYK